MNESDRSERPRGPQTRFSLASFGDEAVLLDLETSGYFMVNRSAERIFRILIEEEQRDSVERRVAAELRISDLSARAAVEDVMRQLAAPPARLSFPGPFTYLPLEDCYQLSIEGRPILDVRLDGRSARQPPGLPAPIPLAHTLRVAAPKLLSHSGLTVSARLGLPDVVRIDRLLRPERRGEDHDGPRLRRRRHGAVLRGSDRPGGARG